MTEKQTIYGAISKKSSEDGTAKTGKPYTRFLFEVEGKKYSCFDEKIGNSFKVGDYVKIELEKSGEYWNMKSMSIAEKGTEDITQPEVVKVPQETKGLQSNEVVTRAIQPHSYEFGKAGSRHKIYYDTPEELANHIELLRMHNLVCEEEVQKE